MLIFFLTFHAVRTVPANVTFCKKKTCFLCFVENVERKASTITDDPRSLRSGNPPSE